ADHLGIVSDVNAEDFVVSDVALLPLDAGRQRGQHFIRHRRGGPQLGGRQSAGSRHGAFDHVLGHDIVSLGSWPVTGLRCVTRSASRMYSGRPMTVRPGLLAETPNSATGGR